MGTLERKITREQAQLLFDDIDTNATLFYLRLVPADGHMTVSTCTGVEYDDHITEQDAMEFIGSVSGRLFSETR
jgi:hypothetical protein